MKEHIQDILVGGRPMTKLEQANKEIERLNNELANIKKFKNSILEELEKRTLEVNKLKNRKRGKMKEELKEFGISLEDIEESNKLFENIQEAIDKIRQYTLTDRFEVVLNNNLIESKEKLTNYRTILGCRISYDNLDKNISFIVKEDNKPTYEELENIIKEVREYIEYQLEHLDFEKDTKAKMLGAMVLVMLDKENK